GHPRKRLSGAAPPPKARRHPSVTEPLRPLAAYLASDTACAARNTVRQAAGPRSSLAPFYHGLIAEMGAAGSHDRLRRALCGEAGGDGVTEAGVSGGDPLTPYIAGTGGLTAM